MRTTTRRRAWMGLGLVAVMTATGCSVNETNAPAVTGPSELGLSIKVTATPDVLTMDGLSQSSIVIEARNSQSAAVPNLGFRADVVVSGEIRDDVGRLSSKTGVTNTGGQATLAYTAPESPTSGNSDSGNLIVSIRVIPSSSDYSNAVARTVDIRLVPQGAIQPVPNKPVAAYTFSPAAPVEGQTVQFDATTSRDCPPEATTIDQCTVNAPTLTDFSWDFGDGSRGNGVRSSHDYSKAGTYTVTLTVTNQRSQQDSISKFVTVGASSDPVAIFTSSPSGPAINENVFFNASGSKAATGRTIVGYDWAFGDGGTASGVSTSHRYSRTGSFVVTLTVTDDLGKTGREHRDGERWRPGLADARDRGLADRADRRPTGRLRRHAIDGRERQDDLRLRMEPRRRQHGQRRPRRPPVQHRRQLHGDPHRDGQRGGEGDGVGHGQRDEHGRPGADRELHDVADLRQRRHDVQLRRVGLGRGRGVRHQRLRVELR